MKNITLFFTFFLLSTIVIGQNIKALDEKNGFREYNFGVDTNAIPNLMFIGESGGERSYKKTDEKMSIGDAEIESIQYIFYKNQLSSVYISTNNLTNSRAVLRVLRELYGNGYKPNQFMDKYNWSGKRVYLVYDENSITGGATILMWSKLLYEQKKADEKENAKNAKGDM